MDMHPLLPAPLFYVASRLSMDVAPSLSSLSRKRSNRVGAECEFPPPQVDR